MMMLVSSHQGLARKRELDSGGKLCNCSTSPNDESEGVDILRNKEELLIHSTKWTNLKSITPGDT